MKHIGESLKALRTQANLTRADLAARTKAAAPPGVDQQTIYRIEAGEQKNPRRTTLARLAAGLAVAPEALTGHVPLPKVEPARVPSADDAKYSINVTVDAATRNAFTLVQRRYNMPITRIVEIAPLLFVLAAEGSLARRKNKLEKVRNTYAQVELSLRETPHLSFDLLPDSSTSEALDAEAKSISARDILGEEIFHGYTGNSGRQRLDHYEESHPNPFVLFLTKLCGADSDDAEVRDFDRRKTDFFVCYKDALKLADGDEDLADSVIWEIPLHKMPEDREFDGDARIEWLREQRDLYRAAKAEADEAEELAIAAGRSVNDYEVEL